MSGGGSGNASGDMGVTPARTQEWGQAFGPLAPDPNYASTPWRRFEWGNVMDAQDMTRPSRTSSHENLICFRRKALLTDAWIPARTQEWGQAFGPLAQGPKPILVAFKGKTGMNTTEAPAAFGPLAQGPKPILVAFKGIKPKVLKKKMINFRQKRAEARAKRLGTAVEFLRPPKRPFLHSSKKNNDGEELIAYRSPGVMRDGPPMVSFLDWTEADPLPAFDDDVSGFDLFFPGCIPEEAGLVRPEDHPGHCPSHPEFAPSFVHVPMPAVPTGSSSSASCIPASGPTISVPPPRRSARVSAKGATSGVESVSVARKPVSQRWIYEQVASPVLPAVPLL